MADACCSQSTCQPTDTPDTFEPPVTTTWWQDRTIVIPLLAGAALILAILTQVLDFSATMTSGLYWLSLLIGGSQFIPASLAAVYKGRIGIGTLMTISAIGAIALGHVEEAAALAFLYSLAEALEHRAMQTATEGLRSLLALIPQTVRVIDADGRTTTVRRQAVVTGMRLQVVAGETVATDATVLQGEGYLDCSAITGESLPVAVRPGDAIFAGSSVIDAALIVEATSPGTDNSLTQVVTLVQQAQYDKGERARLADRLARPLVPAVVVLAALIAGGGMLLSDNSALWIERALVVLVAASPCALALSVPVTVISAIGAASRAGIVVKSGATFENLGKIRTIAFDKTGTLTQNQPIIVKSVGLADVPVSEVIAFAAAVESQSSHPLAKAFRDFAVESAFAPAEAVTETTGWGIAGIVAGHAVRVGKPQWFELSDTATTHIAEMQAAGMTVIGVEVDGVLAGICGIRDQIRPEAYAAIQQCQHMGIRTVMLTGDHEQAAQNVAEELAIDQYYAQLLPHQKVSHIQQFAQLGDVAMVGDGINDAPALAAATTGIAMGLRGSDVAIESADVTFGSEDLRLLASLLAHARRAYRIMMANLVISAALIAVLLPLALFGVFGLATIVVIHECAEVIVILNGLRAGQNLVIPTSHHTPSDSPIKEIHA
ncbi:cation-translocating P-type ATPase [Corynebacterium sp. HS2168-gen11]|uniref:heavy metal translocating P-type ATPase n=1 Tax=Corynebacterium sp. HS2168-gen11 TaxID=2974027 RepID=UPI00216B1AE8|nr:cation-translocating P-type ATPase [Corynebacterium sp. HS2168-gen11]MCS4535351.1 cation-translocating P-type ATPase [Corynebacterium sp. HS2168-gen11]